uniref:XRE family transcriptional regulator n=1 Tax=Lactococcus garvieae TaxID=1363 RepID=UPI00359C8F0E
MASEKTYEPFDELLKGTGMTFKAIARKSGLEDYQLYRLRIRPSKLNGELIAKIVEATKIDKLKLFEVSYFFAKNVDISQQVVN